MPPIQAPPWAWVKGWPFEPKKLPLQAVFAHCRKFFDWGNRSEDCRIGNGRPPSPPILLSFCCQFFCQNMPKRVCLMQIHHMIKTRTQTQPAISQCADKHDLSPHFHSIQEWRPHQESNLDLRFRKPLFYPLNYGGEGSRSKPVKGCHCYRPSKMCEPLIQLVFISSSWDASKRVLCTRFLTWVGVRLLSWLQSGFA